MSKINNFNVGELVYCCFLTEDDTHSFRKRVGIVIKKNSNKAVSKKWIYGQEEHYVVYVPYFSRKFCLNDGYLEKVK
jgi:hypothetical protein